MSLHCGARGCLREEAEAKVGGAAKLQSCLDRGAAKVKVHNGIELIFFPAVKFGQSQTMARREAFGRSKDSSITSSTIICMYVYKYMP